MLSLISPLPWLPHLQVEYCDSGSGRFSSDCFCDTVSPHQDEQRRRLGKNNCVQTDETAVFDCSNCTQRRPKQGDIQYVVTLTSLCFWCLEVTLSLPNFCLRESAHRSLHFGGGLDSWAVGAILLRRGGGCGRLSLQRPRHKPAAICHVY